MKVTRHSSRSRLGSTGETRGNADKGSVQFRRGELLPVLVHRTRLRSFRCLLFKSLLLSTAILAFLTAPPAGQTQQFVTGATPGGTLRNSAAATYTQASVVIQGAGDWARRAAGAGYRAEHFQQDFANAQLQFTVLRQQFNSLGTMALQLGRPRANNAVAELDAGLSIIAELFTFLQNEFNSGTLDQKTIVRTSRTLQDAVKEWQRELKKNGGRLEFAL